MHDSKTVSQTITHVIIVFIMILFDEAYLISFYFETVIILFEQFWAISRGYHIHKSAIYNFKLFSFLPPYLLYLSYIILSTFHSCSHIPTFTPYSTFQWGGLSVIYCYWLAISGYWSHGGEFRHIAFMGKVILYALIFSFFPWFLVIFIELLSPIELKVFDACQTFIRFQLKSPSLNSCSWCCLIFCQISIKICLIKFVVMIL